MALVAIAQNHFCFFEWTREHTVLLDHSLPTFAPREADLYTHCMRAVPCLECSLACPVGLELSVVLIA